VVEGAASASIVMVNVPIAAERLCSAGFAVWLEAQGTAPLRLLNSFGCKIQKTSKLDRLNH
jgi:hypothetical protein